MPPLSILVVEDEEIVARDVQRTLERLGYNVPAIAPSGQAAIKLSGELTPDLILMDVKLRGEMDGVEAAAAIQSSYNIPSVFLTAYADEATLQRAKQSQPYGYLVKPFDQGELHTAIQIAVHRHQMEQQLRASQDRYRSFFEEMPVALYRSTPDGRLLDANPALVKMLNYPDLRTLLAVNVTQLYVDPEQRFRWQALFGEGEDSAKTFEVRLRRWDGQVIWVRDTARAFRNQSGRLRYYDGAMENISERKQAEIALACHAQEMELLARAGRAFGSSLNLDRVFGSVLAELSQALGVFAASIWLIDHETGCLVCRQASGPSHESVRGWRLAPGEGVVGWAVRQDKSLVVEDALSDSRHFRGLEHVIGLSLHSLLVVPLRVREDVIGALQVVDEQAGRFSETDLPLVESLATAAAIAIENARLYEQAQGEIVERQRAQEALRLRTLELARRNEELDAYAHTVAHDLKNPVGIVNGFVELLMADLDNMTHDDIRQYLNAIAETSGRMTGIVSELLMLAGVRNADVKPVALDMSEVVFAALGRLELMIAEHEAEIIVPDGWPSGMGHAPWVEEVWVNYVSNGLKYGGRPPRIELGAGPDQEDNLVRFWVRDSGPGLTPQQQANLFVPFERLGQHIPQGHGLGLSIVRRIVERLGGQVGVTSVLGQGSVFSFSLPKAAD